MLHVDMDSLLIAADNALRTLAGTHRATRPYPAPTTPTGLDDALDAPRRRLSGALMRVNHVGEICAQGLYQAQALCTKDAALKRKFEDAAREETDHLAWTRQRLRELGARPSLLNPLWYGASFAIGCVAARRGDPVSLGFVVETERQVERHLDGHLDQLPTEDTKSRAIVRQMKVDEAAHAEAALAAGAVSLPFPVRWVMRVAARLMTTTAHYI